MKESCKGLRLINQNCFSVHMWRALRKWSESKKLLAMRELMSVVKDVGRQKQTEQKKHAYRLKNYVE